jgi:hypothetical protein
MVDVFEFAMDHSGDLDQRLGCLSQSFRPIDRASLGDHYGFGVRCDEQPGRDFRNADG